MRYSTSPRSFCSWTYLKKLRILRLLSCHVVANGRLCLCCFCSCKASQRCITASSFSKTLLGVFSILEKTVRFTQWVTRSRDRSSFGGLLHTIWSKQKELSLALSSLIAWSSLTVQAPSLNMFFPTLVLSAGGLVKRLPELPNEVNRVQLNLSNIWAKVTWNIGIGFFVMWCYSRFQLRRMSQLKTGAAWWRNCTSAWRHNDLDKITNVNMIMMTVKTVHSDELIV